MTATSVEIDYHTQELRKVATDLRNERAYASPLQAVPGRIRLAVGQALVQFGTALAADNRRSARAS